jgi:hypothetical protein
MKAATLIAAVALACASLAAQAVGQRADVTIYDRASGRTLPVYWHEGRAYVVGRPGNEYQVIVRNRVGEDLLAVVSVDGLNVMNGEPANPRQSGYIISSWSRMEVKGWRKSLDDVAAFYFTTLGDSYAGRTGRPANVGVIGVALFQRKHYEPPPEAAADPSPYRMQPYARERSDAKRENYNEEPRAPKLAQDSSGVATTPAPAASAPLGTGHGRREESRTQWVAFERATDTPVETIAIYYDSYRNLVAQGVLQQPMGRRDPNPFPTAFTPDP